MTNPDFNFYVFRDGRRSVPGDSMLLDLRTSLSRAVDEASWTEALLRCGELECALEDIGSNDAAALAIISDECARVLVGSEFHARPQVLQHLPSKVPGELRVATPEGFAYYALHPLQYADVMERLGEIHDAVVVGIRSIGTTLSAVAKAALQRRGMRVERFTVRPLGHPFDRIVQWREPQLELIHQGVSRGANFVIVDEGPGLSGSSFLSVAEALCSAGVREEQIAFVPGHAPNPSSLHAPDAARRWAKFRCLPITHSRHPQGEWIGAGAWRSKFLKEGEWPGAWTAMERAKFLDADRRVFWKFEGLGPYGTRARKQAQALAGAGFGARIVGDESGFIGYEFLHGQRLRQLNGALLERIAGYCAFRAKNFSCELSAAQPEDLAVMMQVNFEREFGEPVPGAFTNLEVVLPIFCDGKMSPHEWLQVGNERLLKLDATAHGDDHFFPGPCDVAWDLAGTIVEGGIDAAGQELLLRSYQRLSGDDAAVRVGSYQLAYAVFRLAWSRMAAAGMKGTPDEERLLHYCGKYRRYAERLIAVSAHG